MVNSIARNNNVHARLGSAISISESHNNQIYNNTISYSGDGIDLKNSTNNKIHDNIITNSTSGIDTNGGGVQDGNIIYNNHFINSASNYLKEHQIC
jgi:parallel beta-helix repeat protein